MGPISALFLEPTHLAFSGTGRYMGNVASPRCLSREGWEDVGTEGAGEIPGFPP